MPRWTACGCAKPQRRYLVRVIPFSVLDLAPIIQGGSASLALNNTLELARHAERLGYRRFWLAEHHNMPGIASAATSVVMAHVAAGTRSIRVGAGGVMLPNHAPLIIAEQFGTLAALHPGRIDLGLGRAPGTDQLTARALRRNLSGDSDTFPNDVVELMRYFDPALPGRRVNAYPGTGEKVDFWILGSSLFGAHLAAELGLPYAFASHFAPAQLDGAMARYRDRFVPSAELRQPYVMLGLNVFAAATDEEARLLFSSLAQAFVRLRRGQPGPLPPPDENFLRNMAPEERALLDDVLSCTVIGSPESVERGLAAFIARTGPDEIMVTSQVFDHAARLRSFEITAAARDRLSLPRDRGSR
jgi:luciferase family oxidoreductase group 1